MVYLHCTDFAIPASKEALPAKGILCQLVYSTYLICGNRPFKEHSFVKTEYAAPVCHNSQMRCLGSQTVQGPAWKKGEQWSLQESSGVGLRAPVNKPTAVP